jgi:hypothetical protein
MVTMVGEVDKMERSGSITRDDADRIKGLMPSE